MRPIHLIFWVAIQSIVMVSPCLALQSVTPEMRAKLDREFATAYPQPGDYLPNLRLRRLDGATDNLRYASHGEISLVITASWTCPKTRKHLPAIQQLKKKFGDQLAVTIVYVMEAHPENDICPYLGIVDVTEANLRDKILFPQTKSIEERIALAKKMQAGFPMDASILIDNMDNLAWRALGQAPNMAILASGYSRMVHLRQGWVDPVSLDKEIGDLVAKLPKGDRFHDDEREPKSRNVELDEIFSKLNPQYPHPWNFVRWLEEVNDRKLKLLFERYPTIVNEILVYGAHDHLRATILQLMIARRDLEKVKIVCAAGADVNLETDGRSPLRHAIEVGCLPIVDYLMEQGANYNERPGRSSDLLRFASRLGYGSIARRLVEKGLPQDIFSECSLGMVDAVMKRLDLQPSCGLLFDSLGDTPLTYAVAGNQPEVVRLLLDRKMVCESGSVVEAMKRNDPDILKMLLEHGMSPNAGFATRGVPLLFALHPDRYQHFKILLQYNPDLHVKHHGEFPLHLAVSRNLPNEFATDLIRHGAEIDALTTEYEDDGCGPYEPIATLETALHLAARQLNQEKIQLLLSAGAQRERKDQSGLTPLAAAILATYRCSPDEATKGLDSIQALIDGGCSTTLSDSHGTNIGEAIERIFRDKNSMQSETSRTASSKVDRPFEIRARKHAGLTGLNASKLPPNQITKRIGDLLQKAGQK